MRLRAIDDYATDKWDELGNLLDEKIEVLATAIGNRLEPLFKSNTPLSNNTQTPVAVPTVHPVLPTTNLNGTSPQHLQQHYMTIYELASLHDSELVSMENGVQIWYRCTVDKTDYHSALYQLSNSTRINNLVCIEQTIDANANYSYRVRPERMIPLEFYAYV